MSTYTDLHLRRKENLTILRMPGHPNDGLTPQRVIFANPENIYEGTFKGTMEIGDVVLSNMTMNDSTLSNCELNGCILNDVKIPTLSSIDVTGNANVKGNMTIGNTAEISSGYQIDNAIAIGQDAVAIVNNSFVWNGDDKAGIYTGANKSGTFNINPADGLNGFFIGDQSLCSLIVANDPKGFIEQSLSSIESLSSFANTSTFDETTKTLVQIINMLSNLYQASKS